MIEENPLDDVGTPREVLDRISTSRKDPGDSGRQSPCLDDPNVLNSKRLREAYGDGGDDEPDSSDDPSDMEDEINNGTDEEE